MAGSALRWEMRVDAQVSRAEACASAERRGYATPMRGAVSTGANGAR